MPVVAVIGLFLLTSLAYGQQSIQDPLVRWLAEQKASVERQLSALRSRQQQAQQALENATRVRAKAEELHDSAAAQVAQQAVTTAETALAKLRGQGAALETQLSAATNAININRECSILRTKAANDREALRRQFGASELVREGSSSRPTLIAARTGTAAARLVVLAYQFNQYTRIFMDVIQNFEFIERHASELRPVVLTRPNLETMRVSWNGLNAARSAEACEDQLKGWTSYSHLMENGLAVGQCAEALAKAGEFIKFHGEVLEKIGKVLGIAIPAVELANEVRELHEELSGLQEYTQSYPDLALQAAKRLDERQKATLQQVADCQSRVVTALGEFR